MTGRNEGTPLSGVDNPIEVRRPPTSGATSARAEQDAPLSDEEYQAWSALIAARLGLYFAPSRMRFLRDRLWRRVQHHDLVSLTHYRAFLAKHPEEWSTLADLLTVNESRFFRHERLYRALQEQILPDLARRREAAHGSRRLSLWSAGCSTGDETYTLAMTVLESVPLPALWEVRIFGTDLSPRNIAVAREGVYPAWRLDTLPDEWTARYTVVVSAPEEDAPRYRIRDKVRALTTFQVQNLCADYWAIAPQDVIVCQNVLIYFRRQEQLRVLGRLYDTLRPGGYLLVGATELPMEPLRPGLWPTRIGDVLVYRK